MLADSLILLQPVLVEIRFRYTFFIDDVRENHE